MGRVFWTSNKKRTISVCVCGYIGPYNCLPSFFGSVQSTCHWLHHWSTLLQWTQFYFYNPARASTCYHLLHALRAVPGCTTISTSYAFSGSVQSTHHRADSPSSSMAWRFSSAMSICITSISRNSEPVRHNIHSRSVPNHLSLAPASDSDRAASPKVS